MMRRIGFVCGLVIVGIIASLALTMDANAQKPFEIWNATYDGGRDDHAYCVAVDSKDNIIVTGHSYLGGDRDYYTVAYDSNGTEFWNATYDGGGFADTAFSVAVDSKNNIIVTGISDLGGNGEYYTIKYDSSGSELWNVSYDGGSDDGAWSVAVDSKDNIIVTGSSSSGSLGTEDYYTIRYNRHLGAGVICGEQKTPGFEAIFAFGGVLAVAYLALRRMR